MWARLPAPSEPACSPPRGRCSGWGSRRCWRMSRRRKHLSAGGANVFSFENCARLLERSDSELSTAADCFRDQVVSGLFGAAVDVLDERGKALFGEHFHLEHRLNRFAFGG